MFLRHISYLCLLMYFGLHGAILEQSSVNLTNSVAVSAEDCDHTVFSPTLETCLFLCDTKNEGSMVI